MPEKKFYSYLWLRENGTPYYAGKGTRRRAYWQHGKFYPPPDFARIIIFPMASESLAFESEKALIELFGRKDNGTGILYNLTDGGQGHSGCKTLIERNRRRKGLKHSEEHKRKISKALKGRPRHISMEARRKISKTLMGRKAWPNGRAPYSEETLRRMSLAAIGRIPWNKGQKGLQTAWNKGKTRTNNGQPTLNFTTSTS